MTAEQLDSDGRNPVESTAACSKPAQWFSGFPECVLLFGVVVVGALLRFYKLAAADGTIDELATSTVLLGKSLPEISKVITGAPIPFVLQWFTLLLTGQDDKFGIRLSGVLVGIVSIPLLYGWIRSVASRPCALMGAFLLACSYYHFTYSREARYYACVVFFAIAFLWVSSLLVKKPNARVLVLFALSSCALVLSHYFGVLAVVACLLALPVCAAPKLSAFQLRRHSKSILCAVLVVLPVLWYVWTRFIPWLNFGFATRHAASGKLTHGFDISPRFLLNRFEEYLGIPESVAYVALALSLLGLVVMFGRNWRVALTYLSILALPWLMMFYSKPEHFWETKYFIFMLPILVLFLSVGIFEVVNMATTSLLRIRKESRVLPYVRVCGCLLLVSFVAFPNLSKMFLDFRYPANGLQWAAEELSRSASPDDKIMCTSNKTFRFFRSFGGRYGQDFPRIVTKPPLSQTWSLEEAKHIWVADIGRKHNSKSEASFFLSDRFSRIPLRSHWGHFLAYGPSVQGIRFGHNACGSPDITSGLAVAPKQKGLVSVLFPREGKRAVVVRAKYDRRLAPSLGCSIGNGEPVELRAFGNSSENLQSYVGIIDVPFGKEDVSVFNGAGSPVELESLSFVPMLHKSAVTIPAWDFLKVESGLSYGMRPGHDGPHVLLETILNSQIVYTFFAPYDMDFSVTLHAKNDRPFDNAYLVYVESTEQNKHELVFDRHDNRISSRTTPRLVARRGLNNLVIVGVTPGRARQQEESRNLWGHEVSTPERRLENALASVTLNPPSRAGELSDADGPVASRIIADLRVGGILFYFDASARGEAKGTSGNLPLFEYLHHAIASDPGLSAGITEYTGTEAEQLRDVLRKHPYENIWILSEKGKLGAGAQMTLYALDPSPAAYGAYTLSLLSRPSTNLFPHGDFEVRRLENISFTEGVTVIHAPHAFRGNNTVHIEVTDTGISAAASFDVTFDEHGSAATSLHEGETYNLSFWMKHKNVEAGADWNDIIRVFLTGKDGNGQPFYNEIMSAQGTQGWTRYALPFEVGRELPSNSTDVIVKIGLFGGTGALWLDDVQLEQGSTATPFTRERRISHTERLAQMGF